jgi:hypothetical protein
MSGKDCMPPEMLLGFLYGYHPSFEAAVFGAVLFGVLSLASLWPTIKSRAWFMLLVTLTAALEAIGYAGRVSLVTAQSASLHRSLYCAANQAIRLVSMLRVFLQAVMSIKTPCEALSGIYVSSNFFLVVTPVLVAIVEYSSMGKLLMFSNTKKVLGMRNKHIVWIFSCW